MEYDKTKYYEEVQALINLEPGTRVYGHWIRMRDSIDKHLEGYFFDTSTGEYQHASRMAKLEGEA